MVNAGETTDEQLLRVLQVRKVRQLIRSGLILSGTLFIGVGLSTALFRDRIHTAEPYQFIFGQGFAFETFLIAFWSVAFTAVGTGMLLATFWFPRIFRAVMVTAIMLQAWWVGGLGVELALSFFVDPNGGNSLPVPFPLLAWTAWLIQLIRFNRVPRIDVVVPQPIDMPTDAEIERAVNGNTAKGDT